MYCNSENWQMRWLEQTLLALCRLLNFTGVIHTGSHGLRFQAQLKHTDLQNSVCIYCELTLTNKNDILLFVDILMVKRHIESPTQTFQSGRPLKFLKDQSFEDCVAASIMYVQIVRNEPCYLLVSTIIKCVRIILRHQ